MPVASKKTPHTSGGASEELAAVFFFFFFFSFLLSRSVKICSAWDVQGEQAGGARSPTAKARTA